MDDWRNHEMWRKILERRLNELGSMVKGNQSFQADRIADIMEQIESLGKQIEAIRERQDKIADYVRANVPKLKTGEE